MPLPDWMKSSDEGDTPVSRKKTAPRKAPPAKAPPPEEPAEPEDTVPDEEDSGPGAFLDEVDFGEETPVETPVEETDVADESTGTADQVLGMLSSIEKQLAQLSDIQREHEQHDDEGPILEELEDRERELHDMRKRLGQMQGQLEKASEPPVESDDLHRQLDEAQTEIEDLVRQTETSHAELQKTTRQLRDANEQVESLQSRVEALEQELSEPAEAPGAPETDEDEIEALQEQVRQLQDELGGRGTGKGARSSAEQDASDEIIERQRKQIERLTDQLESVQADADPDRNQQRDERIAELEEELERAQAQAEAHGKGKSGLLAGVGGALSKVRGKKGSEADALSALEFRIEELTAECEQLRDEARQATGRAEELEAELDATSEGDGSATTATLQRRVRTLEKELAVARGGDNRSELHAQQAKELREQWKQLREAREALKDPEQTTGGFTLRRQAMIVYSCLVGLVTLCVLLTVLVTNQLFPATLAATVNLDARNRLGGELREEDLVRWDTWHRQMLREPSFLHTVAKRLGAQRLDEYGDAKAVAARLEADLTIDSPRPGALTLTFTGTDRGDLPIFADTVATTLASESSRTVGSRSDSTIAVVRGERMVAGRARYAAIRDTPVRDRRLFAGIFVFAAITLFSLFVISRIHRWLQRTKGELEENDYEVVANEGF